MGWKEFLYYRKGERIAVILLLILIVLTLILNGILSRRTRSEYMIIQNDSLVREFEEFQHSLKDKEDSFSNEEPENYAAGNSRHHNVKNTDRNIREKERRGDYIPFPVQDKFAKGENILLNETDTALWKKVPGIGSVYASRIVKYRNLLGGFVSVNQLREVYGVDNNLFFEILPYIREDGNYKKIDINEMDFKELLKHPYLNYQQVKAIFSLRDRKGKIQSLNELSFLDEFTSSDIERLKPYLIF